MITKYCSIDEPACPSHLNNALIRQNLLKDGDLPWINDMAKAWRLMERLIELSDDNVIDLSTCVEYIPANCPTSQRIMSFKDEQVLSGEMETKAYYHCFFSLPRKLESDDPRTCEIIYYDFLHEKPEMAIYAMAAKVAELVKDYVIPRNWLREPEECSEEMKEFLEFVLQWIESENCIHEG